MFAEASTALTQAQAREDMQTFVFSATLSKDLQQNLKKRNRKPMKKGARKATALGTLVCCYPARQALLTRLQRTWWRSWTSETKSPKSLI